MKKTLRNPKKSNDIIPYLKQPCHIDDDDDDDDDATHVNKGPGSDLLYFHVNKKQIFHLFFFVVIYCFFSCF